MKEPTSSDRITARNESEEAPGETLLGSVHCSDVSLRFYGCGGMGGGDLASFSQRLPAAPEIAWLRQIHSADLQSAIPGHCGEGDALHTTARGLALAVVTADCVPVLLAAEGWIAAVHAGWRGIVQGIVGAGLGEATVSPSEIRAWIGPAIGPCCYEVGEDVARQVAEVSDDTVIQSGKSIKPHLDLQAAVRAQLSREGVREIQVLERCTYCHPEQLYSFRRNGPMAGRNVSLIWRPEVRKN